MQEELFLKNVWWNFRGIRSRNCISINSLNTAGFKCWKTNFKTEICHCSGCPTLAILWIKEVEVAKSVDDLLTSQSIEGHVFFDFEMLDVKIASALYEG